MYVCVYIGGEEIETGLLFAAHSPVYTPVFFSLPEDRVWLYMAPKWCFLKCALLHLALHVLLVLGLSRPLSYSLAHARQQYGTGCPPQKAPPVGRLQESKLESATWRHLGSSELNGLPLLPVYPDRDSYAWNREECMSWEPSISFSFT